MAAQPSPVPAPPEAPPTLWEKMRESAWMYLLFGVLILVLDLVTGPHLMFPILFVIPVTLSAWYRGPLLSLSLSVALPLGRLCIAAYVERPGPFAYSVLNALIRMLVLGFIAALVSRTARQTRELSKELKILEGILPICMFCKKIRDEKQEWQPLEGYIAQHSEADFSHGLCPECADKHYGHILGKRKAG